MTGGQIELVPRIPRLKSAKGWLSVPRAVIHPLIFCPPVRKGARYALVARGDLGNRSILGSGMALNSHPPLNLAVIRRRGARLGATEVIMIDPLPSVRMIVSGVRRLISPLAQLETIA